MESPDIEGDIPDTVHNTIQVGQATLAINNAGNMSLIETKNKNVSGLCQGCATIFVLKVHTTILFLRFQCIF